LARPRRVQRHGRRQKQQLPEGTLNSAAVARIAGVSLRQLQWWDEKGILSPLQYGHSRAYTPDLVRRCILIADLLYKGCSLKVCRRALRLTDLQPGDLVASLDAGKTWFRYRHCDTANILSMIINAQGAVLVAQVTEPAA
jgi:DNA-binding transcriptional MerR regulator